MQTILTLLQDNALLTAICGIAAAGLFQLLKRVLWFEDLAGNEVVKGRVASLLVAIATTLVGLAATGEWAGALAAILAAVQTWFVAQGAWAGLLRGVGKS